MDYTKNALVELKSSINRIVKLLLNKSYREPYEKLRKVTI